MFRVLSGLLFFLGKIILIFCAGIAIGRIEFLLRDNSWLATSIAELPFAALLDDFRSFAIGPILGGFAALAVWSFRVPSTYRRAFAILALGFFSFDLAASAINDLGAMIFGYNAEDKSEEILTAQGIIGLTLWVIFCLIVTLLMFAYPIKAMLIRRRPVQIVLSVVIATTLLFFHETSFILYSSSESPYDTMPIDEKKFVMQWVNMQQYILLLLTIYVFSKTAAQRKTSIQFRSDVIFKTSTSS